MPIDEKNSVTKTVRSGPTSPRSRGAMADSPKKIAAIKAPRAGLNPKRCAPQAAPRLITMANNTDTSRLPVGALKRTTIGTRYLLKATQNTTKPATTPNWPTVCPITWVGVPSPPRAATSSTSGITAMSCTSKMPRAKRPCTESTSARRASTGITTPVDDRAKTAPKARPAFTSNPKSRDTPTARPMVATICSTPVSRAVTPSRRSRDQLNSRPMVNISSVTPRSAMAVISRLSISCSMLGPSSSPAPIKPTIALCLARSATDPNTMATVSSTMMPSIGPQMFSGAATSGGGSGVWARSSKRSIYRGR